MRTLLLLLVSMAMLPASRAADLEIVVDGITAVQGDLLIGIFDSEENFRKIPLELSPKIEIADVGAVTTVVKDLKPGAYSVAVIWDQNRNGVVDTAGPFNKPIEPVAFSNAPKASFGPPKFKDCMFVVTETGGRVTMMLQ